MRIFGGGGVLTRVIAELKAIRKFGSLEAWKFGGNKVSQLWQDFTCPDFIRNLLPFYIDLLRAKRHKFLVPYCPTVLLPQRIAFTMAEILISLTIIGIIAALTLPALQANINEKTWATQSALQPHEPSNKHASELERLWRFYRRMGR